MPASGSLPVSYLPSPPNNAQCTYSTLLYSHMTALTKQTNEWQDLSFINILKGLCHEGKYEVLNQAFYDFSK